MIRKEERRSILPPIADAFGIDMYTPTRRRDSVSESTQKFTPSKRGQAALDALALGYDVQLPDYSLALLPRTSVSEQALASFISTGIQQAEQLPRSTTFADSHLRMDSGPKQHRNRGSDISDKKRAARQGRSPVPDGRHLSMNEGWISDFSISQSSAATPTADSSSRASTSSYQPSTSQYVLESPQRTQRSSDSTYRENHGMSTHSSHTPRSLAEDYYPSSPVRHHSMAVHQTPSSVLAGRSQGQNKANTLVPAAPTTYDNEESGRFPGTKLATRSHPSRPSPLQLMDPLPEASSVEHSLDAYFSPRSEEYQINIQQLGGSAQYARIHSGIPGTRPSHGQPHSARPRALKSPAWSASGVNHSPVDRAPRQPSENEVFYGDPGPSRSYHHHSSSEPPVPVTSARRNSRPQAGSQRPQLASSLVVSPLQSYGASSSGQYVSSKPRLRVSTQSIPGSSTQPLRSAPLPSTASSSRTTSSFHDDDEAFKVHPERAAVSRMETMLMLSSFRAEAQGPKSGGIMSYPATDGVVIASAGHDYPGYPGPSPQMTGHVYQTLVHLNLLGLSDTKAQGPQETPREMGYRPGSVISPQERSPANRRPRQRSGSMGLSSFPDSPHRPRQYNNSFRHRQRSASVIVQGLSPDAVKKLRMYEQLKNQDKGRPESLRAIVGCTTKYKTYGARPRKNTAPSSAPVSPTQIALPPSPIPSPVISQKEASSVVPPVTRALDPPSPRNVPLPLSPPQSPTIYNTANYSSPIVSTIISTDSFRRYHAGQGIESPRPIRTRQNTNSGRVIPTLRLISSPAGTDPQSETGASQVNPAEEALENGATPSDELASLKSDGLKLDPQLERILTPTPPPAFWSPTPHSAVVRTSAPLPLLPAANVSSPSPATRAASISLPATRTASALPLRPMSVPPPGDPLRVGDSDDVRRVWSCQPAPAELPPVKSFAGDWRQSMVIELSDEEEEEEESTDTDFSELEDEDVVNCQVLDASDVVVEGDLISLHQPKSNSINDARMRVVSQDKPAESKATSKGVVSSGVGSGVNAVEAVQHAIVKLALDNAEAVHSQRMLQARPKRPAAPLRAGSMTAAYPTVNQPLPRHSLDTERPRDLNPPHALPNHYPGAGSRNFRTPNMPVYPHPPTNLALETLRSGLELRAAASASAVEEAVRARSASPNIPQDGHMLGPRPSPAFVLPPRLQRLQGIHPRKTPAISTPRLEVPALPTPRLDIPALQHRRSSYESSLQPASPAATLYPGTFNAPPYFALNRQYPTTPLVQERNHAASNIGTPKVEHATLAPRHSNVSEASTSSNRGQLANIVVDNKPIIPPAPATAPLARDHGERKRQTRRSAEAVLSNSQDAKVTPTTPKPSPPVTEPAPSVGTPTTQSTTSSPKPKPKGGKRHWPKRKKDPALEQAKAATPASSTPVVAPPEPTEHTPSPKKSASPPKKESASKSKNDSAPVTKDSSSSTPKPKRKYKPPKKHKSTKPGATATPAPAVTS